MSKWSVMVRVSQAVFYGCGALLFVAATYYVLVPLKATTLESKTTIHDTGDVSRGVRDQVKPAAQTVGIILRNAAVIADETAKASTAQKEYWHTASQQTTGLIKDTRSTVVKYGELADSTKGQLPETFGRANTALGSLNTSLLTANTQMAQAGPLFASWAKLAKDADDGLESPELAECRRNMARIVASWAAGSEDVQKKLHHSLYPDHRSRLGIFMDGVRVAGPIGSLLYDFSNIRRR